MENVTGSSWFGSNVDGFDATLELKIASSSLYNCQINIKFKKSNTFMCKSIYKLAAIARFYSSF